jgi:hypothetical protein
LAISAFIQATELILLPKIHLAFIVPRLLSDEQNFELAILSSGQEQLVSHADVKTTMNRVHPGGFRSETAGARSHCAFVGQTST